MAHELQKKVVGLEFLQQPELFIDLPDGALAEALVEVFKKVGRVLIPLVPLCKTREAGVSWRTARNLAAGVDTNRLQSSASSAAGPGRTSDAPNPLFLQSARRGMNAQRRTGSNGRARG